MGKGYYISKSQNHSDIIYLDYDQIAGYDIKPRNTNKYGIAINKMIIVKPSMIQKILIKKTKAKMNLFLKKIVLLLEDDDNDGEAFREALNDMTRYKNIVNYKYRKYLDDKYVDILNKKVTILEQEIKRKLLYFNKPNRLNQQQHLYQAMYNNIYDGFDEEKTTRHIR